MMMNNNLKNKITQLLLLVCIAMLTTSCRETFEQLFSDDIAEGDEVTFSSSMRSAAVTRGAENREKINANYTFKISMLQENVATAVGEGTYKTPSDDMGTLEAVNKLYWPSTVVKYGFTATAGTDDIAPEQYTEKLLLEQDRLEGMAEAKTENGTETYLNANGWKAYNKNVGLNSNENYKKVPLFMQHKRALITVILKAGVGVSRKSLYYSAAAKDIVAKIYSYKAGDTDALAITPYARGTVANYDDGADSTTCYEAIVAPHDYYAGKASELISTIGLSGQNYSFKGENDEHCNEINYKLTEGKHLTLTITLGRDNRQTLMSAYIEDWTEEVTNTICDDHGNSGAPIEIYNRDELIKFLTSTTANKKGNLALVKDNINLEDWSAEYNLDCTLSLGGHTLISNYRFLKNMSAAASLLNGTIQIGGTVSEAIAETNEGTINDVKITAADDNACATVAGAVKSNHGNISKCYSNLRVVGSGTEDYVGGIAATSLSSTSKGAIIDGCTVTNRVSGGKAGGGIVGNADGQVVNNVFEYGITLGQNHETHKNIAGAYTGETFTNNAWPTVDESEISNATPESQRFTGIIDDASEFSYTKEGMRYRLAQNIKVEKNLGNATYELDGNGKQITTKVMVFDKITNKVHDLKVLVSENLIATPSDQAKDCIAALASEVHGVNAEISNVKVVTADGVRIQAANPAGVVVWAWGDATIKHCEVLADIQAWVKTPIMESTNVRKYAGGIVSTVSKATVTQCAFYSKGSIKQNLHEAYNDLNTEENKALSNIIYYGGIVGGIEQMSESNETPMLTITDCSSHIVFSDMNDKYRGAILGYAENDGTQTTKDCQGNWWDENSKAVGTRTRSVEATIGKRNSQTPTDKSDL